MILKTSIKYAFSLPNSWGFQSGVHLDLGCGTNPRNPFMSQKVFGLDVISELDFNDFDVEYRLMSEETLFPFADNSIDSVSGFDFLEHLSRSFRSDLGTNEFIHYMNEVSRVLRPGGVALFVTPAFPGKMVFSDPTHQNFITIDTIKYFVSDSDNTAAPAIEMKYGYKGDLRLISQFWVYPPQLVFNSRILHDDVGGLYGANKLIRFYLKTFFRSPLIILNGFRKRSHLVWVLEKPNRHR